MVLLFLLLTILALAGRETIMAMEISSPAFAAGGTIPTQYTCQGQNLSPPLSWTGIPEQTKSLVLIIDDPDAPDPQAPKMTWVHWVLYNLPPDSGGLPEAAKKLPPGTEQGLNDWNKTVYGGPCPPIGRHRYFHKLYALDIVLTGLNRPTKALIEQAMVGHILDQTELIGTYQKR
jgi:Raf kinase inhibitor-like YbhB/YbcL family protein